MHRSTYISSKKVELDMRNHRQSQREEIAYLPSAGKGPEGSIGLELLYVLLLS